MAESVEQALGVALTAYQRFAKRAHECDHGRPTRLAGWTVGDLVDHVTWGAAMEADALRTAAGLSPAAVTTPALRSAVDGFGAAIRLVDDPEAAVVLPGGAVPLAYAAPLFAFEAALHASDLDHALGRPGELNAAELSACEVVIGPMLDLVAATAPTGPVAIDLLGLDAGIRLISTNGAWGRATPDETSATTTVSGDPAALVLFACGRVGADDPRLTVTGDPEHAVRFKTYFPGP